MFSSIQTIDVSDDQMQIAIGDIRGSISIVSAILVNPMRLSLPNSLEVVFIRGVKGLTPSAYEFLVANGARP